MDDETAQAMIKILTLMGKEARVGHTNQECRIMVFETVATIEDVADFADYVVRVSK